MDENESGPSNQNSSSKGPFSTSMILGRAIICHQKMNALGFTKYILDNTQKDAFFFASISSVKPRQFFEKKTDFTVLHGA